MGLPKSETGARITRSSQLLFQNLLHRPDPDPIGRSREMKTVVGHVRLA